VYDDGASTVGQIIQRCDDVEPNAFDTERKVEWLGRLDGQIALEVWRLPDVSEFWYRYPESMDWNVLVKFPYDQIYEYWLRSMISHQNGETDKYELAYTMYNNALGEYTKWFWNTYKPMQGYISHRAYGHLHHIHADYFRGVG
jgi:hypothetical protein